MVNFEWENVKIPFIVCLWLVVASIARMLFHAHKKFGEVMPDSALMIVVGLVLGVVLKHLGVSEDVWSLSPHTFFMFLLPAIIFDASYFMPNRQLFENIDSVLLFAVVGTVWSTIAIGSTILLLNHYHVFSIEFSLFEGLIFASLISAVDPVAVIAVFEEINVNEFLFVNVFGEALFNDGISLVLFQMFRNFIAVGESNLQPIDYVTGLLSFFVIALGAVLIGVVFAVIVSFVTRFTGRVKVVAPVLIFAFPYMSYLMAEIIAACAICMKQYVKGNISQDAANSVKYMVKVLGQCTEIISFLYLGLSTISSQLHWDVTFLGVVLAGCLVYRVIGVVVQCALLNRLRNKKFTAVDQCVLCFGGLRGAIAFGLVKSMDDNIPAKNMFVTTCIAVVFFTVFLQGIAIRPLLYWLKVERQQVDRQETVVEKVYGKYCDHTMAGLEAIAGFKGRNTLRDMFERFNSKVLKPNLMKNEQKKVYDASVILRAYSKITLQEALRIAAAYHSLPSNQKMDKLLDEIHTASTGLSTEVSTPALRVDEIRDADIESCKSNGKAHEDNDSDLFADSAQADTNIGSPGRV